MTKLTDAEKEQLQKIINDARAKLSAESDAEKLAANQTYVGKCFKFRNSYGDARRGWWLYVMVVGATHHSLKAVRFEDRKDGTFEIEMESYYYCFDDPGFKPISRVEFIQAWDEFTLNMSRAMKNARLDTKGK